jgi:hypothetical protein
MMVRAIPDTDLATFADELDEDSLPAEPDAGRGPTKVPDVDGGGTSGGGRLLGRLRPRRPGDQGRLDLRNTWQVVAGSILVPLGVVFILIAWYGSAHTPYVQQQIPYLVSGSFAGVACIVLGGLLYWAHWLYRLYDQADHHHEEQLQAMQQTLRVFAERLASATGNGALPEPGSGAVPSASSLTYVVTSSGTVYHDPRCPIVAHHPEGVRVLGTGAVLDMDPCGMCLPTRGGRS